jgi:hypothetical protein
MPTVPLFYFVHDYAYGTYPVIKTKQTSKLLAMNTPQDAGESLRSTMVAFP